MDFPPFIIWIAIFGYLAVPLVGLWAFPRRRWIWMFLLFPFGAFSLAAQPLFGIDKLSTFSAPAAFLVLLPICIAVIDRWTALRMSPLFWFVLVMCTIPLARGALFTIMGEAWYNLDGQYCWDSSELSGGKCRLNPWLLAEAGLGYTALAISFYGSIPAIAILLFVGWQQRRKAVRAS